MPSTTSARNRAKEARRAVAALTPLGPVVSRPMFGGHGLWLDDVMFAFVSSGTIWLKADPDCRRLFEAGGGRPFVYRRQGRNVELSFLSVPEDVLADPPRLLDWAEAAVRAARRTKAGGRSRRSSPSPARM